MILRNKKPLNNLYQIFLIYLFSVIVYIYICNNNLSDSIIFYMVVSLMSASFILGHGIFLLTWESTYFCFFMTRKISIRSFFQAKYLLFFLSAIALSVFNVPVIILTGGSLLMYFAFLIFNIGTLPILIVSASFFNNERASLDKDIFFNYEGYGIWQYLLFLLEIILPGLIFSEVSKIWSKNVALFAISFLGIIGLTFLIFLPCLFFSKRRYPMISGFNQK
jgi:hypothetical protein